MSGVGRAMAWIRSGQGDDGAPGIGRPRHWARNLRVRARARRAVLAVAGAVFALLAVSASLSWSLALAGFLAVGLAALVPSGRARLAPSLGAAQARRRPQGNPAVRDLVDALPDPAFLVDGRRTVQIANRHARHLLEIDAAGQPVSFVLRAPEVLEALDRVAETGEATSVHYFERVPVGRWFEAHLAPVALEGAPRSLGAGALVVLHDLTQAQRLERMRADFVAHASHELRTPLASLSGFIETLQGPAREDAAARERFLAIMQSQAQRMSRLIDDLLSLSRIELSAHLRPDTRAELGEIVRHVADLLGPLASEEKVRLDLDLDAAPVAVWGDRDELIRVVENLVENAIKYAGQSESIEIAVRREHASGRERAVLSVRDRGPGIAPEHVPRLTERFYRVDAEASRGKGGTGLGLAIVKHIVNRHRGQLDIDSQIGRGTTFIVRLDVSAH